MKNLAKQTKSIYSFSKKTFAGASGHKIDYNLKEFDICFVGGLHSANVLKYMQHTGFKGTMALFSGQTKFCNELFYDRLICGDIAAFKYLATSVGNTFNIEHSAYFGNNIASIDPKNNTITDNTGKTITYKTLVLGTGLDQDISNFSKKIENLTLKDDFAHSRVFLNHTLDDYHTERNKRILNQHTDNDFVVYLPKYPSRREAYDSLYLGLDTYLSWGIHNQAHNQNMKVRVVTPNDNLFRFPFANEVVMEEISNRQMVVPHFGYELVDVEFVESPNATRRYGIFKHVKTGETMRLLFGSLLITPENKKRSIYNGNDIANENGEVTVNPYTLQHTKYSNIFAFGDCADVPTTKSFYATLNQGVVLRNNLTDYLEGKDFKAVYEGYSSFPVGFSIDRYMIFGHYYNWTPSFGNFYVPKFLGRVIYKLKGTGEKQLFAKVFSSKPNFGWPWFSKNRYFRPIEENRFVQKNGLSRKDLMIHSNEAPILSFSHGHGDAHAPAHSH